MCFVVILSVSFSFVEMVPFTANNSEMALLRMNHRCNNDKNCNIIILCCKVLFLKDLFILQH